MNVKSVVITIFAGLTLICMPQLRADTVTASINCGTTFTTGSAASDTLNVASSAQRIKATDAQKIRGAADSQITVVRTAGTGTVHVADVSNRSGDSSYSVSGVYESSTTTTSTTTVTASPETWTANYHNPVLVTVKGITIVAGPPTQMGVTGASNWTAVKSGTDFAIAEVEIDPDTPEAADSVSWSTGDPVANKPKQRRISLADSKKVHVQADGTTIPRSSASLDIWVLWATVTILHKDTDTKPANAPNFNDPDGKQTLGPVVWANDEGAGRICVVAKLSPVGVHSVVKIGWAIKRNKQRHDIVDGEHDRTAWDGGNWWPDNSYASYMMLTPDDDDQIYDIDGPSIHPAAVNQAGNPTQIYERNVNFIEWIRWGGKQCSEDTPWYYHAKWTRGANPSIAPHVVDVGSMVLPN